MEHFNKCNIPKNIFHKSNPINRQSIQQNGLLSIIGENYQSRYGGSKSKKLIPAVFMYHTAPDLYDTTWDDDIWSIDLAGWEHQIYKDKAVWHQTYLISFVPIPLNRLKLFHIGTGKDFLIGDITNE